MFPSSQLWENKRGMMWRFLRRVRRDSEDQTLWFIASNQGWTAQRQHCLKIAGWYPRASGKNLWLSSATSSSSLLIFFGLFFSPLNPRQEDPVSSPVFGRRRTDGNTSTGASAELMSNAPVSWQANAERCRHSAAAAADFRNWRLFFFTVRETERWYKLLRILHL